MSITSSNKPRLYKAEDYTLPNHDTCKVPSDESQRNTADPLVAVSNSSVTDYDSADESSVCSNPLPPLEKLAAHAGKLKNVKMKDDPPLAIVMKELNELKLKISKNKSSYSRNKNSQQLCGSYDHETHGHNKIITLRRVIKPRNPQHVTKNYETCRSNVHTITDHNDIKWFRKREALQAKKAEIFKTSKTKSSSALRSKTPTKRLEAIRIFLAFATYMNFIVYQMDVKSAFLNGKLKEEVYVKQPPGFESSEFPTHVCKLDKALYGLKQVPRA
ncbi:retrovirus-related pol polyprotein from transposon TNT 1-94, partial [Tanacetum coccineum]